MGASYPRCRTAIKPARASWPHRPVPHNWSLLILNLQNDSFRGTNREALAKYWPQVGSAESSLPTKIDRFIIDSWILYDSVISWCSRSLLLSLSFLRGPARCPGFVRVVIWRSRLESSQVASRTFQATSPLPARILQTFRPKEMMRWWDDHGHS